LLACGIEDIIRFMTLNFQMRKEDVLAFNREYLAGSVTFQRTRKKVRYMLPVMMIFVWLFTLLISGFEWSSLIIFMVPAVLWYFLYPARYDRRVERYTARVLEEPAQSKNLGPCELTLSEDGLHSKSNTGESKYYWSAVDRVLLTEAYLFIFLTGPVGYPIPVADVGSVAAKSAYDYAVSQKPPVI
jgi:hypothetical protein